MYAIILLNFICPFVMLLVGHVFKRHPSKDISRQNGYNTPTARQSQAHWDYAQKVAPDIFIKIGIELFGVELVLSVAFFMQKMSIDRSLIIGLAVGFVFIFYAFYRTELKIEEEFKETSKE